MISPRDKAFVAAVDAFKDETVVVAPDGIAHTLQCAAVGGAIREQIDCLETTESELFRERHCATNSRIVVGGIGGARIEHDEYARWLGAVPLPPEEVAILLTSIECGAALHA